MPHHLKAKPESVKHLVTPQSAGWDYLGYQAISLKAGESYSFQSEANEAALVPLKGSAQLRVIYQGHSQELRLNRKSVFTEKPHVLYLPPQTSLVVSAEADFEFAIGTAPAEGKYPVRVFKPDEIRVEVRGGGPALREVHHILSHPMPAERLILFEVYIPGGMWSGWPPHCHDEFDNSPYLEETYHFFFDKPQGFGLHRNYNLTRNFDEVFSVYSDDLVLVTQGYHPVAACPGSTMYFLNYLAGKLYDDDRKLPPIDDPEHTWIKDNWDAYDVKLPLDMS
ncbi:MAG: 5-deoxy-glucuronate isomerase [Deinococcales bacterium]